LYDHVIVITFRWDVGPWSVQLAIHSASTDVSAGVVRGSALRPCPVFRQGRRRAAVERLHRDLETFHRPRHARSQHWRWRKGQTLLLLLIPRMSFWHTDRPTCTYYKCQLLQLRCSRIHCRAHLSWLSLCITTSHPRSAIVAWHSRRLPVQGWPLSARWSCADGMAVKQTNGQERTFVYTLSGKMEPIVFQA